MIITENIEAIKKLLKQFEIQSFEHSNFYEIDYNYKPLFLKYYNIIKDETMINSKLKKALENTAYFLNINDYKPAYRYSIKTHCRKRQISDKRKVLESLKPSFAIYKNKYIKNLENLEKIYRENNEHFDYNKRIKEFEDESILIIAKIKDMQQNSDKYTIKNTEFKKDREYNSISYFTYDKKQNKYISVQKHMSKETPNILFFKNKQILRADNKINAFMENATCLFGNIFYQLHKDEKT